jgi:hypothetical protein
MKKVGVDKKPFTFDFTKLSNFNEKEFQCACWEFGKVVNSYVFKNNVYSDKLWNILETKFGVTKNDAIITTSMNIDEKNRVHKNFGYVLKLFIDDSRFVLLLFNDELKGWEAEDYTIDSTENDISNKISGISIYYDEDNTSTEWLEQNIIKELSEISYHNPIDSRFYIISNGYNGYELKPSLINYNDINIELNYGDKFLEVYDKILNQFSSKKNGLYLFYGSGGCGITTFIRHLIKLYGKDKSFIYIPNSTMDYISSPDFISFISNYKNVVLILENCDALISDSAYKSQTITNILNLTDGLLNDFMDIQIICTFNVPYSTVDPSLKRPGRLLMKHEFKKLTIQEANRLCEHLGFNKRYNTNASLAEIYNETFDDEVATKIGFGNKPRY